MKVKLKIIFIVLLLAVFTTGCGCGGGGGTSAVLVSLEVTPTDPSIALGTNQQFAATGIFSDNSTQDLTNSVTWSSSDTSIATMSDHIESSGLALSQAIGSTTITATYGSVSGSTTLTVTAASLVSIAVSPADPTVAQGITQQFTAIGTFSDNKTQDITTSVEWSSSDTSIATISDTQGSKGLATSIAAGLTTIAATSGSISGSTKLTVTAASLVSITVTPANKSVKNNTTVQYSATGHFSDNSTQDITTSATWSSSDTSVATISNASGSRGFATGVTAGSTTIVATSGSISGSTLLTVTDVTLLSITVTPANKSVGFHTNVQYTATGHFSDNTSEDITTSVTWSSSNTSVATISNQAGSKGLATTDGVRGATIITATLGSVSGSTYLIDP